MMQWNRYFGAFIGLAAVVSLAGCPSPAPLPTVAFSIDAHLGETPFTAVFTDHSAPPPAKCDTAAPVITGWAWDFGDGSTGSGAEISHVYETPGLYTVKLTIALSDGTTGTIIRRNTITALDPDRVQGTAAGEERTVAGMDFVWIPAGTFIMGSDGYSFENEFYIETDAAPTHEVTISRGFWMGKYEVRQDQWLTLMGDNPALFEEFPPAAGYPVESVSWNRCQDFVEIMNQSGEGVFRLPTEAEWEYACRAGTTTIFSFDATWPELEAHAASAVTSPYSTQPAGQFLANPWGLHDMHGNVWEWVQDIYHDNYYTEDAQQDPVGPDLGPYRTVRGGSFRDPVFLLTSATRTGYVTVSTYSFIGFRLVLQ